MLMSTRSVRAVAAFAAATALCLLAPIDASAQSDSDGQADQQASSDQKTSSNGEASDETDDSGENDKTDEDEKKSAHGSYDWKPSWGVGLEYGQFYSGLNRWDQYLLDPNGASTFDAPPMHSFELAGEISPFEGSRFTAFAGLESPLSSSPSILSVYGGIEPAFAFRRGPWSLGFGVAVAAGTVQLDAGDRSLSSGLVTLRPNLEVRRYINEKMAAFVNVGFKQWLPFNADTSELDIRRPLAAPEGDVQDLYEGSFHASIGFRFGHYPEHVKQVPDSDDDGLRDDIDECPDKPEDEDGFEDKDGCPDTDNDGDGIADADDECPDEAEDMNGWKDEDGCPDADEDEDGDGIASGNDECPDKKEDKDGYQDDDGCPDTDNDGDDIADADDDCPDEQGIELNNGCPSDRITISGSKITMDSTVEFTGNDSTELTSDSKTVLRHAAQTIQIHPEFRAVRIDVFSASKTADDVSAKRAQAVMDFMVAEGLDAGRLTTNQPDGKPGSSAVSGDTSASATPSSGIVVFTVTQKTSS
jgi:outer membrane protein OmpA-like peptidoglycan-associated protein